MSVNKIYFASVVAAAALFGSASFAVATTTAANTTATTTTKSTTQDNTTTAKTVTVTKTKSSVNKSKKSSSTSAGSKGESSRLAKLEAEVDVLEKKVQIYEERQNINPSSKVYAHGPAIVSSPYVDFEEGADYGGADLLINMPSINKDVVLLKNKKAVTAAYAEHNINLPDRPVVAVSGKVEVQAENVRNYDSSGSTSDIGLSAAELMIASDINPFTTGLIKLKYEQDFATTPKIEGANIKVSEAFITLGNLDKTPFYASAGQMYVPFVFDNNIMITDTAVKVLGKTKEQPLILGFTGVNGLYGSVYAFNGDSYVSNNHTINQWGTNLGYVFKGSHDFYTDFGVGFIANMADAEGMQNTPSGSTKSGFMTFGGFSDSEQLKNRVPAADAHLFVGIGEKPDKHSYNPFAIVAEYVAATTSFDRQDLSFDGHGATPRAIDVQGVHNFKIADKPSYFAIGYDHSWEALGLNLPEQSFFTTFGVSLFKDTLARVEYRHDFNYDSGDTATAENGVDQTFVTGNDRDIYTGSFEVFF